MKLYAPRSVVSESALNAIFAYGLCDRPDVVELADMIAIAQDAELQQEHIELAYVRLCPEVVN